MSSGSGPALVGDLAPQVPALVEHAVWQPSEWILFSVVSSLVMWSFLFVSVYGVVVRG